MPSDYNKFFDQTKKGTLIISYYRSGSHFLQDAIHEKCPMSVQIVDEICTDNSPDQLYQLVNNTDNLYWIGILNQTSSKYYIRNDEELLNQCHIVRLTRKDKVGHFISHWFWSLNTDKERINNNGKFLHNSTPNSTYRKQLDNGKVVLPLDVVEMWLQEQTIVDLFPSDFEIDYDELSNIDVKNFRWTPNRYEDITLSDIFENHKELENLLLGFKKNHIC